MPNFRIHRSMQRFTRPLKQLFAAEKGCEVIGVAIYCGCSDGKVREVEWDWKLAKAVLGFIAHRQGGTLKLSQGQQAFLVEHQNSSPAVVSGEKEGDAAKDYNGVSGVTD